jgi:L-ascorbate metabolism protein UlaG (beta-lactamase superfamily)
LIEIDDKRILTDPVWSHRISFTSLFGPKRFFAPPFALDELEELY